VELGLDCCFGQEKTQSSRRIYSRMGCGDETSTVFEQLNPILASRKVRAHISIGAVGLNGQLDRSPPS
jgi:hypothetical protein